MNPNIDFVFPTYSGNRVDLGVPSASAINLIDMAHGLSQICRYGGQTRRFYSVAEHSIRLAMVAPVREAKTALLHDASEYLLLDIPRQIKLMGMMHRYKQLQTMWERAVFTRFQVSPMGRELTKMDLGMVAAECKYAKLLDWDAMAKIDTVTDPELVGLGKGIHSQFKGEKFLFDWGITESWGWTPAFAEKTFLTMAAILGLK